MLPPTTVFLVGLLLATIALPVAAQLPEFRSVELRAVARAIPADATVEAIRQVVIAAQVSGRIVELRVDAGQTVRQGELLLRLDARESAEAAAAARAALVNARANHERARKLFLQKFVSAAAVDKARAELDAAVAAAAGAGASQSHALIVAPLAGVVAVRHVEAGDLAVPGKPLLTLFDPAGLRVVASVPQYRLAELKNVRRAIIEFPETGRRIESTALTILPTVDSQTHVVQVRVGMPAGALSGMAVLPGMAARVHFVSGEARRLSVPPGAVVRRGEVAAVYVRAPDGRLSMRQLRLGETGADGEVEVLSGLQAGDSIALDPVKAAIHLKSSAAPAAKP